MLEQRSGAICIRDIDIESTKLNARATVRIGIIKLRAATGDVTELRLFQNRLKWFLESLSPNERLNVARNLYIYEQMRIPLGLGVC
jgi:hypothetical protein